VKVLGVVAAIAAALVQTAYGADGSGGLRQLSGRDGCVAPRAVLGCASAVGASNLSALAVSPDGANVYAAGGVGSTSALVSLTRTPAGGLRRLAGKAGCIHAAAASKQCTKGRALETPSGLTVSPDGRNVYVAAANSWSVDVFSRRAGGRLVPLAGKDFCTSGLDTGGRCVAGRGLGKAAGVAVSPDGKNVYVAGGGLASFSRKPSGALVQLPGKAGCATEKGGACMKAHALLSPQSVALTPDGRHVIVAGGGGAHGTLAIFLREPATGALTQLVGDGSCFTSLAADEPECTVVPALQQAAGVTVGPGGTSVYVASLVSSGALELLRDPLTGLLSKPTCVTENGSGGRCRKGSALVWARGIVAGSDAVYTAASHPRRGGVATFSTVLGPLGCVGPAGCARGRLLGAESAVVLTPDGRNVIVAGTRGIAVFAAPVKHASHTR
jgi:DNA-binding beta-propeller fold protein YncE